MGKEGRGGGGGEGRGREGLFLFLEGVDGGIGVIFEERGSGGGAGRLGGGGVGLKRKLFRFCHFFRAPCCMIRVIFFGRFLFLGERDAIQVMRSLGM